MISLEGLLAEVLDLPEDDIEDGTGRDTAAEWTSLAHIQVVTAVEGAFGIALTTREISEVTTVGRLREVLREKGVSV
jgi:acyl carrier protein